jgi:hypothetical protein
MARRVSFWALGLLGAAALFAVANGVGEYLTARSSQTFWVVNGVEHELTPDELVHVHLVGDTLSAIPSGLVVACLLSLPLFALALGLRRLPAAAAYPAAVGLGALAGGALSVAAWLVLGGWGPPMLFPAVAAGAWEAAMLEAACRARALPNPSQQPTGRARR